MSILIVFFICSQVEIPQNSEINLSSPKDAINKLKLNVLKSRLNIDKIKLRIHGNSLDSENGIVKSREFDCIYWLDGKKKRRDFKWTIGVPFVGVRQISGLNIEKMGYGFTGSSEADVANRSFLIVPNKVDGGGTSNDEKNDLRVLGIFNCGFGILTKFHPSTFLLDDTIKDPVLNKIVYKGKKAYELTWNKPNGVSSRAIFLPESGNGIVLLEDKTDGMVQSVESELEYFKKSNTYFPVRVKYFQKIGETTYSKEDLQINVELINEPISSDIFTFSGLGLPEGSVILDYSDPKSEGKALKKIVDGKAVDSKPNPPALSKPIAQPVPFQSESKGNNWHLAYIAAGVASLALGIFALYLLRFSASK
jgi:hypothetical protein